MTRNRLEAFSDGVLAIIITIMVLELKVPHNPDPSALLDILPVFLSYVLSFIYLGIYWNNHHHLLQTATSINGLILWANLHLLFWLSLVPFTTGWMGENDFAPAPVALYGFVLFMAGIAYFILSKSLVAHHGTDSPLARAIGHNWKGKLSVITTGASVPIAFFFPYVSGALLAGVAVVWFLPDRRIENALT